LDVKVNIDTKSNFPVLDSFALFYKQIIVTKLGFSLQQTNKIVKKI